MNLSKILPVIAAVTLLVVTALVQGYWSERWDAFPELQEFAQRIEKLPLIIGDWQGKDMPQMDKRVKEMAGAVGALSRTYTNRLTDEVVNMHVVCGRMQDVFHHSPDRCYPAAGFSQNGSLKKQTIMFGPKSSSKAEFRTAEYIKSVQHKNATALKIFWSWSADGPWEAPDSPKLTYAGQRALYKVYLENAIMPGQTTTDKVPSAEFAEVALPELTKSLFPGSQAAQDLLPQAPKDDPTSQLAPPIFEGDAQPEKTEPATP